MRFNDALDRVLEATVVPSFTRIGPAVRSRTDHWTPLADYDLRGRVIVITGATSGLGLAATRAWLAMGAHVEMLVRNADKAAAVCSAVRDAQPSASVDFVIADTGDLEALQSASAELRQRHRHIDVLVHNAGALDANYATVAGGLEATVASQVVGPFRLSAELHEQLVAAPRPARIVWVTSGGMYTEPLDVAHLCMNPDDYKGTTAYARAKRAQVTLTEMMAQRCDPNAIVVHSMHPGWALTPGVERSLPTFRTVVGPLLRSAEQGADTLAWLAADEGPARTSGKLWLDRRVRPIHRSGKTRASDTAAARESLWEFVTEHAHTDWPPHPQDSDGAIHTAPAP